MKFLVNAHLPPGLCAVLARHGHALNHTLDLPEKNSTKDSIINQISIDEERVVISKDSDFFCSQLVLGRPWRLVLVRIGNTSTDDLCSLFESHLPERETALEHHALVEIDRTTVTPLS